MFGNLIEERMADVLDLHASRGVPIWLEGQTTEHVIDVAADAFDPLFGPSPQLRRDIKDDSHSRALGILRDPPIEAGKVDHHHGIGTLFFKVPLRLSDQFEDFPQQRNDDEDAHHRHVGQSKMDLATGGTHLLAAISDAANVRPPPLQLANQMRRVLIATRLADGKEQVHERFPSRDPTILGSRA